MYSFSPMFCVYYLRRGAEKFFASHILRVILALKFCFKILNCKILGIIFNFFQITDWTISTIILEFSRVLILLSWSYCYCRRKFRGICMCAWRNHSVIIMLTCKNLLCQLPSWIFWDPCFSTFGEKFICVNLEIVDHEIDDQFWYILGILGTY